MIIILEGPDGSGKSTLASSLQKKLPGYSYIHHGPYKGFSGRDLAAAVRNSMSGAFTGVGVIIDRCWISEPIYANVFRKQESRLSPAHVRMLERIALAGKAVIINCLPPFDVCKRAFISGRDEMMSDVSDLRRVYDRYASGPKSEVQMIKYDYTTTSADELLGSINALPPKKHKVLIVGDKPNGRTSASPFNDIPFVSFSERGCGIWLSNQLDEGGIRESDLAWYNAFDMVGRSKPVHSSAIGVPIVALGERAMHWCVTNNLICKTVPHPSVHKEYYQDKPYHLITKLKEICNAKN